MAKSISFRVSCVPVPQPRQRHRVVTAGGRSFAHNYTPTHSPVNTFKAAVMHAAVAAYSGPPIDCPLSALLVFVMPRPAARVWKTKPMPREPYAAKKNDWDNLGKSVCDALNKLLYIDDGLLSRVTVERWIAAGDEQPHCLVTITEIEP